jgi:hypothetical protein
MCNGQWDGSVVAMGNGGGDGQWWRQWAMVGVTMGDSNSGGTIPMAVNGGGAMDARTAATAHWLSHELRQ